MFDSAAPAADNEEPRRLGKFIQDSSPDDSTSSANKKDARNKQLAEHATTRIDILRLSSPYTLRRQTFHGIYEAVSKSSHPNSFEIDTK